MTSPPRQPPTPPSPPLRAALDQTVPDTAFSPEGLRQHLQQTAVDRVDSAAPRPRLHGISLKHRLLADATTPTGGDVAAANGAIDRFQVMGELGSGATSHVFSVLDLNLERQIAVKVLDTPMTGKAEDVATFIDEARINADLRHPNVLPVHDLDVTEQGQLFFAMNQVEGRSLGDILKHSTATGRDPKLGSFNTIVSTFLDIAHAIAYAHHKRIVHQDLKPDNILLGDFGEVLVLDWGSAVRVKPGTVCKDRLYGTPLYMSPEQARRSHVDASSDIYCLGACLFHALTLRLPTWADDIDEFWRKKRDGIVDPPTATERARVPAALLDIALKAMAPRSEDRYRAVETMIVDLEHYQSGLAVSAHHDSPWEWWRRFHRRHWRLLWSVVTVAAVVVALTAALYGERLKEIATWGQPVLSEDFADAGWRERWQLLGNDDRPADSATVRDGWLVTTGTQGTTLYTRKRLFGPTAIEFDGRMDPSSPPGDLSVIWSVDDPLVTTKDDRPEQFLRVKIYLQTGAEDNTYVAIIKDPGSFRASTDPFRLQPGVTYHLRMEIDNTRLSIAVDGRKICEYTDVFPFASGYLGLYGYYPGKAFSKIRLYSKGVPEKVGVLSIGDNYFLDGGFARAAEAYQKVTESHATKAIGQEAFYKQGLALLKLGDGNGASAVWDRISDPHWRRMAECQRLEQRVSAGDHQQVADGIARIYPQDAALQQRLRNLWNVAVNDAVVRHAFADLRAYLQIQERLFSESRDSHRYAALALSELEEFEEVLRRYPEVPKLREDALKALERQEEVIADPDSYKQSAAGAYLDMGRFDELRSRFPQVEWAIFRANLYQGGVEEINRHDLAKWGRKGAEGAILAGDFAELLKYSDGNEQNRILALTFLNRSQEALALLPGAKDAALYLPAFLLLDRAEEALQRLPLKTGERQWARYCLALGCRIAADRDGERRWLNAIDAERQLPMTDHSFIPRFLLRPFLRFLDGDAKALAEAAVMMKGHRYLSMQRAWFMGRFLAGEIDETQFLAQPCTVTAPALLLLAKGFKAEAAGDHGAALAAWRQFMDKPPYQRLIDFWKRDALVERFVAWRIRQLEHPPVRKD